MRAWPALAGLGLLAACTGLEGVPPPLMGANEMQQRPGLFSGPEGEFVLVGSATPPADSELVAEVGAGT